MVAKTWLPALLGALAVVASAAPSFDTHVLHERRHTPAARWTKRDRIASNAVLPMRIGLSQQNLDSGYDYLMDVSHPDSPNYGKHWSEAEVHDMFSPAADAVEIVKAWLAHAGIDLRRVVHSDNKQWLAFDATVEEAERLLRTEYHEHHNDYEGSIRIGCDEYYVPKDVAAHVDYIVPGVQLSPRLLKTGVERRDLMKRMFKPVPKQIPPPSAIPYIPPPAAKNLPPSLSDCGRNITPTCIKYLYNIPNATKATKGNEMGLFEESDTFSQADINKFLKLYAPNVPVGTKPTVLGVDGGAAPVHPLSQYNTGESDIDIDMALSLIYPQSVTVYQINDRHRSNQTFGLSQPVLNGFINNFLDAIDGSYCNYTAFGITGNSPKLDGTYPDPYPGGYKGELQCGVYKPTNVISISYGEGEHDLPVNYQKRQCNEYMKLGLRGVTVLVATGDYGVASFPGDNSPRGCLGKRGRIFNPGNPQNCPYVLAVGATQLYPDQTVLDAESALHANLSGTAQNFSSSGGFSNIFTIPSYQSSAVQGYFKKHGYTYPYYNGSDNFAKNGGIYNIAGRATPDVSANGAEFRAFTGGVDYHYYGTSLAAPLWGAIINLINEERLAAKKKTVGFVNPTLYANPSAMTDIVNGTNPGCGTLGFKAVSGWDPVTGLGTPKYPALLKLFMSLP